LIVDLQVSAGEINNATGATNVLIIAMEKVGDIIGILVNLFKGFAGVVKAVFNVVFAGIVDGFNQILKYYESTINFAIKGLNRLRKEQIEPLKFSLDVSTRDIADVALQQAQKNINDAVEGFKDGFDGTVELFSPKQPQITKTVSENLREISKDYRSIAEKITEVDNKQKTSNETLKQTDEQFKDLKENVNNFGKTAGDAFGQIVTGAKSAREAIVDLLRSTASNVASGAFQNLIGVLFKSGSKSSSGGSFLNGITSRIGSLFGSNSGSDMVLGGAGGIDNNILSLNGTPIGATSRGETLSIRPAGGSGGGSGINVYQTINVSTGVQETVQAELVAFLPVMERTIKAGIAQDRQRGIA
jgi:hypothetical protein